MLTYKAGLVLLRKTADGTRQVCLTQVKAKNPAEQDQVDFGLPKGTRQYFDEKEGWVDARDTRTAGRNLPTLEPLAATVIKETEQEIGLPPTAFAERSLRELGNRPFVSRKGDRYDVCWYVLEASDALIARMDPNPQEAHRVAWFSLTDIRRMAEQNKINKSYVAVIEEVLG